MVAKRHGLAPLSAARCAEEHDSQRAVSAKTHCDTRRAFYDLLGCAGRAPAGDSSYARTAGLLFAGAGVRLCCSVAVIVRCNSCWGRKILRPDGVAAHASDPGMASVAAETDGQHDDWHIPWRTASTQLRLAYIREEGD